MSSYTIISASNREDNKTKVFATHCLKILEGQGLTAQIFNLEEFLPSIAGVNMYDFETSPMSNIVEKYLSNVDKLLFVIPEYNGSFPGIVKLFIDSIHPANFKGKKAALIGISSGKAGNSRGMDHLTSVLHYIKVNVFFHKLSIASIDTVIENGSITDLTTQKRINKLIEEYGLY